MKKLLGYVLGIPLAAALVAALIPLGYGMLLLLAVTLPVVCACTVVSDAWRGADPFARAHFLRNLGLALLGLPIALLAFAAPFRGVLLAILSFYPAALARFNEMHAFLYVPLTAAFGESGPYWLDVYWGALSVGVIFLIALLGSIFRNKLARQVRVLPTAKIRSVAIGLAELKGRAIAMAGAARGALIMRRWMESTGDGHAIRSHAEPFYLDDGTGRILVDPRGATIDEDGSFFEIGLHQAILKRIDPASGFSESRLVAGDTVYVVGNVQINRDKEAYPDAEVVVKPSKTSWLSMRFSDLFFVSNIGEAAVLRGLQDSVRRGWLNVVLAMAFGVWLCAFGLANVMQFTAGSVEGAPAYLRLILPPTTLEREIEVPGLGVHPTADLLKTLGEGDREKTDAIMAVFRELGLQDLATSTLLNQASRIDARGFAVANYWLGRMDALPRGQWGTQLFYDEQMTSKEALVTRIMTRYEDRRLFVSYRAFAGRERVLSGDGVRSRKVVVEVRRRDGSKTHTAEFPADVGLNKADGVEAFEYLEPGRYEIFVYLKTVYRSGRYDRGSRTRKPFALTLED